jgi:hypothetical protein
MNAALVAAVAVLAGKAYAAHLPHYDVTASVDTARGNIDVTVKVILAASDLQAVNEFRLGTTYEISSVSASPGAKVEVNYPDDSQARTVTLRCEAAPRQDVEMRLRYHGPLAPTGTPPLNLVQPNLVELNLDSFWLTAVRGFPPFTVHADIVGLPTDSAVVANGVVHRSGEHVLIRRETGDIDLALVAIRGLHRDITDGFELCAADLSTETARVYLHHGPLIVKFLESWFGPMPGRPARVVVVNRERKSGYSRPGYIVVTESSRGSDAASAKFMAHEFAHAWWHSGDPRTENRWLSESMAEYISLRYVESSLGQAARDELLAPQHEIAAKAGPMLGAGESTDAELYSKRPLLLFDLESRIGRAHLDHLLASLAPHPPAITADFMSALAAVAGPEEAAAFDQVMHR